MPRLVITAHRSNDPNPITLKTGEVVVLGEADEEYPGWIRARLPDGNEGWAPESFLKRHADGTGLVLSDYDARELDTSAGESLEVLRELNGWFWARNRRGAEGWVPLQTTQEL